MTETILESYVIFFNPSDFPGEYVVRRQVAKSDGFIYHDKNIVGRGKTLESVRFLIPRDKVLLQKDPFDDPVIEEVWI